MKICLSFLLALSLTACSLDFGSDDDDEPDMQEFTPSLTLMIDLSGDQEVPSVMTSAMASAVVEYDENLMQFRASLDVSDVDGFSAAHIHQGYVGTNGDVAFAFEAGDTAGMYHIEETNLNQAAVAEMLDGGWYINVHTDDNPDGELRGQILTDDFALMTFDLSGEQEVPAVDTDAMGYGYATYNMTSGELDLKVKAMDLDGANAAHIHAGRIGTNGDVAIALSQGTDTSEWMTPDETMIDSATFETLLSGGHYVNVHTTDNPGGEIRGQILTDNLALVTFALNGHQEVPAVMTDAMGSGYALVDTDDYALELKVVTSGVADATGAHIHTGFVGTNGDVLVALEQSMDDMNVWMVPENTMLTEEIFGLLASGGHYVNVHTPDNTGGEIRGQILTHDFAIMTFGLSGEQEVPAVDTDAMGYGYATYNMTSGELDLKVKAMDLEGANAAHIHAGRIGTNGDVAIALSQGTDTSEWMTPDETMIDSATFETLLSGGHYVNVHTADNPGGEIRGQILADNFALVTFGLNGNQEVPAVTTEAMGSGYALVDTNDYALELKIVTSGVADATGAHIHTGRIGTNGDVLVALEQSMDDMNVWMVPENTMLTEEIFGILASGGHYVNVHTPDNTGGEIRGQILTDNLALATFSLDGEQEVPAVDTSAMGSGYALVNLNDYALELKIVTSGVADATGAHIHTGRIGTNGDVLVALEQSMDDMNVWMAPENTMINEEILGILASGGHYVNVHTPDNAGGEIRGQILTDNYSLMTFPIEGSQEVPAVTTDAMGYGYALLNHDDNELELKAVTSGLTDATMAHIHAGVAGVNGDVVVALEQDATDSDIWMSPANLMLEQSILDTLLAAGHYVNIHTTTNPGGELRGQIVP